MDITGARASTSERYAAGGDFAAHRKLHEAAELHGNHTAKYFGRPSRP